VASRFLKRLDLPIAKIHAHVEGYLHEQRHHRYWYGHHSKTEQTEIQCQVSTQWCAVDGSRERLRDGLDDLISQSVEEDIAREVRGEKQQTPASTTAAAAAAAAAAASDDDTLYEWDVYVCQSKPCKERGAGATLDAFVGLAPPQVKVHPAIISKSRGKGPIVRCVKREQQQPPQQQQHQLKQQREMPDGNTSEKEKDDEDIDGVGGDLDAFEASAVDSVDKVYRILTKHMSLEGVDSTACECLKWNYQGNNHLEQGEVSKAIDCYGRAIGTGYADQEGVVLLMRSTAYLKRAFEHQRELRKVVDELQRIVPEPESLQMLFATAQANPSLARALHQRAFSDRRKQDRQFRQIKFRHSLYEYALLHAAQDSLRATQILPHYAKTWLRAGDSLAELRKLREAASYYEKAMEIDPTLVETLMPVVGEFLLCEWLLNSPHNFCVLRCTCHILTAIYLKQTYTLPPNSFLR